jgi:Tfp pilus assembly protein PilX
MKKLITVLAAIVITNLFVYPLIQGVIAEERIAAAKAEKLRAERNEIVNLWRVSK